MGGETRAGKADLTPYLLLGILILLGAVVFTRVYLPDRLWENARLYSILDGIAANVSILLAVLLLLSSGLRAPETGGPWVAAALLGLAFPLEVKSFTENLQVSTWLEVASVVAAGVIGSLVWLPRLRLRHPTLVVLAAGAGVLSLSILLLDGLSGALPPPFEARKLTLPVARLMELGGILLASVSVWFARAYRREPSAENLLFLVLFGLQAFGALTHPMTRVWGSTWWLVQVVQSLPAFLALIYVFHTFRQSQLALVRAHGELERFTAVVSHDLKSPLNTVSLLLGLLLRRLGDPAGTGLREPLSQALTLTARMRRLVDDLLLYSRAEAVHLQRRAVDLEQTLAEGLEGLTGEIRAAGATVTWDPLPTVTGDPTLLCQLMQNLIGNAIKFRGTEPPRVHVGVRGVAGGWEFSVRDNGMGFSMEAERTLFEPFERLAGAADRPGSGLGLPICRQVVRRHGGRIWARSSPGQGAVFYFTLPAASQSDFEAPLRRDGARRALRPS